MTKTALDKKIARLEAELKNAKASKSKEARKERNNQLMAFGIMLELLYKNPNMTTIGQDKIKSWANKLDERNKKRVLAGFARLDAELCLYNTTYLEPSDLDAEILCLNSGLDRGQPGEMMDDGSFCSNGEFNELGFRIEK